MRTCGAIKIITYHAVDEFPNYIDLFMAPEKFEAQMKYIHTHYDIITLEEAVNIIETRRSIPQNAIVITFDDGYKDNYHTVYPIIKRYGLPMTIFISSDYIKSGMPTFVYATIVLLENAKNKLLDLSNYDLGKFMLDNAASKEQAILEIDRYSKMLRFDQRQQLLQEIISKVGLNGEKHILIDKMLTWENISEMSHNLVSFGSHTCRHPNLTHLGSEDLHHELVRSKQSIEKKIHKEVKYFAYPYGGKDALNDSVKQHVKEAGYEAAFVLYPEKLTAENKFSLGRTMISHQMTSSPFNTFSKSLFACEISGFYDFLLLRDRKRQSR